MKQLDPVKQRHPTPAMIRLEISKALNDDMAQHPHDRIPYRVHDLINSAITKACNNFKEGNYDDQ